MKFLDRVKKNKILYFLGVLIVGIFIVLIVRFTYAYFAMSVNDARGDVILNSDETDKLDFEAGDPLSIDATPTTLPENGTNLVDTTTAKATLLANTTNSVAEYNYWVYFTISNNTFIYSDGSTPEIILTITDPEGNPVTNIDGLTYGTFNGVSGFDVTVENGVFPIANGYAITSSSSTDATEQKWNFTLTYLNQSYDQSANFGNSMTTEVSMTNKELVTNEVVLIAENTEIYGSDYSLTNLLNTIGNFEEQSEWSACAYTTTYAKYGSYSCQLDGSADNPEITASSVPTYPLDNTHVYYARTEALIADSSIASTVSGGIYWPIAEPNFIEGVTVNANEWTIISAVNSRASFENSSYPLRLDFNNNSVAGTMYFDGVMLIDLTATYGSDYPDKDYLDNHLIYFNGTANIKTINVTDGATFKVNNINNYNTVTCTNGATATIDSTGTITVANNNTGTTCKLGA